MCLKLNIDEIKQACLSEHGLVNEETRRIVWPILLNLDTLYPEQACTPIGDNAKHSGMHHLRNMHKTIERETEWISMLFLSFSYLEYVKTHKDSVQIQKDIERSLNSFDMC